MFTIIKLLSILILFMYSAASDPAVFNMTISLDKQPTLGNKEIFGEFVSLNNTEILRINFDNINPNISFVVLQIHSHKYMVELCKNPATSGPLTKGNDVGMYSDVLNKQDIFYVINDNPGVNLRFYVSVHGYGLQDPIPGGCNMEFVVPIAPFMDITLYRDHMYVDVAPPMVPTDPKCMSPKANINFYMLYEPEFDFSPETFYDSIKRMMTLEGIRKNGVLVPSTYWRTRRMLSPYPAIGVVFVAVARSSYGYSVYVPSHTYGCFDDDVRCIWTGDWSVRPFCILMFILSACICFMGHNFFKSTMTFTAYMTAFFVLVNIFATVYDQDELGDLAQIIPMAISVVFAGLWLLSYWVFGLPVIGVLLSAIDVGIVVAAIIYYRLPTNLKYLQSDFNFWTLFILVVLLVALALMSANYIGNLLSCAFLGAYGVVISIDILIASNLKFIILNVVRRATTPNFNNALLFPPYQAHEKALTAVWVILATSGLVVQYLYNRGRAPFPPPPRQRIDPQIYRSYAGTVIPRVAATPTLGDNERTPLLS